MKSFVGVGWLGLLASTLACSGTSANSPGLGGEGGRAMASGGAGGSAPVGVGGDAGEVGTPVGAGGDVVEGDAGGSAGPPAQGAMIMTVAPQSAPPTGRACPAMAFTAEVPQAPLTDRLSSVTYLHEVIDGEGGASVACRVAGVGSFEVEGRIQLAGRALIIEDGVVTGDTGTAMVTVMDSSKLSPASLSSSMACTLDVGRENLQIQPGAIWASFDCASVVRPPSSECQAQGYFVLENCEQE